MRLFLLLLIFVSAAFCQAADPLAAAMTALQSGDFGLAEKLLRAQVAAEPRNAQASAVLAVVFDQEHKYEDAERAYKQALAIDGSDPSLANNYGNHLLAAGHVNDARLMFMRAIALEPANSNANVQLAKLALGAKDGRGALKCLSRLSPAERGSPEIELLFGVASSAAGKYVQAEDYFRRVTEATPRSFEAQYDLGLAASKAGHFARAQESLQRALDLRPDDPDVIYDLAVLDLKQNQGVEAVSLLVRGCEVAPGRADVERLLAQSTLRLGYFEDSIKAWDKYLQLEPTDDAARRERAFAATAVGSDAEKALSELSDFTRRFPKDAVGHYELGTALSVSDPERAGEELSRAVQLNPGLTSAYVAKGLVSYRRGETDAAIHDFTVASRQQPDNARILDRLGETYLTAGRTDEALAVLKKAAAITPDDSSVLLHLGRALTKSSHQAEAAKIFARYRKLERSSPNSAHEGGLVEFLSLPPGEQLTRYRAGVERTVAAQPENAEAEVKYLELLLSDGDMKQATETSQKLLDMKAEGEILAEAGRALLEAEEYPAAEEFLKKSISVAGSLPSLQLELARARFYTAGPQSALVELNRIDKGSRTDSYYAARAEMLAAVTDAAKF